MPRVICGVIRQPALRLGLILSVGCVRAVAPTGDAVVEATAVELEDAGGDLPLVDAVAGQPDQSVDRPLPPCEPLEVDAVGDDAPADAAVADAGPVKCVPGESHCVGMKLATCAPAGDGWVVSPCFPGSHCSDGTCAPIANNLIIVFDTSGSMAAPLPNKVCPKFKFPVCEMPDQPCTRMGLSKQVFGKALATIDPKRTRMALFRFPQITSANVPNCNTGHYEGTGKIAGDGDEHSVGAQTAWFWQGLDQIRCVDFPKKLGVDPTPAMALWMNGTESPGSDPELRMTAGTPIGNTLFYVGEYLRHRVFVDGAPCAADLDCGNPNYTCQGGVCTDPARDCRETAVVLYTDGGQKNDPKDFRAPRVQAKRLAFGLGCAQHTDCVGGALCHKGRCRPPGAPCATCFPTGAPCEPNLTDAANPLHCPWSAPLKPNQEPCVPDPISAQAAVSSAPGGNVLRSPDGRPFGVRLHVVDISGTPGQMDSFALATAGNGKLLAADTADPAHFLKTLEAALDMKNLKVCGVTL